MVPRRPYMQIPTWGQRVGLPQTSKHLPDPGATQATVNVASSLGSTSAMALIYRQSNLQQSSAPATFTPNWQPMLLGDGGNAQGVHVFPSSGTILVHVDSYNSYLYKPAGGAILGAKTLGIPSWQPMMTSYGLTDQSIRGTTQNGFTTFQGTIDIVEHPGNTNVFFTACAGFLWVSQDRGATWTKTTQAMGFNANNGPIQSQWFAGDPNDATGNTVYVNTQSNGAFKSTNALSGTSSTFTAISGITASSTGGGGSVIFDPTTSGGAQKIWISSDGIGVYQSINGGGLFSLLNTTGMPTRTGVLSVDKFGQLWSQTGFNVANSFTASVYASGAWVSRTIANINSNTYVLAILFDPNTGPLVANNHVIAVLDNGDLSCSIDNGANWTAVGIGTPYSSTITAPAPQAAWLATANQLAGGGIEHLNINGGAIDASGTIWIPGGISVWTSPNPISGGVIAGSVSWAANSLGIEQLVVSGVWSFPGNSPVTTAWDRAFLYNANPDDFAITQFPQNAGVLVDAFSMDYALVAGSTVASALLVGHAAGSSSQGATSSDGGNTWTPWASFPTGFGTAGIVAASTATNWCCCPGNGVSASTTLYYTQNGGTSWLPSTISGSPLLVPPNNRPNSTGCVTLVAEKGTPGTFYAIDIGASKRILKSTDGGANFSSVATSPTINFNGKIKLRCVPGKPGELFLVGYPTGTLNIFKSTNSGANWAVPAGASSKNFENINAFGFGAPKPGGSGYPTIYINTSTNAGIDYTTFYSVDGGTTFNVLNAPASQQTYPMGSLDYPTWIEGDPNVYGRVFFGFNGSGVAYIDTADACPWVNFSNTASNAALTGTVTLTARHSGLVPVTSVQFSVDGVNIGTAQTGAGPYSVSWNTGGVATGAHTLKVTATGVNGSGSFSIPITTS